MVCLITDGCSVITMAITAWNHGVGSCILGAVERDKVQQIVKVPEGYSIRVVLALGYPLGTSTYVDEVGFLPLFAGDMEGFSLGGPTVV